MEIIITLIAACFVAGTIIVLKIIKIKSKVKTIPVVYDQNIEEPIAEKKPRKPRAPKLKIVTESISKEPVIEKKPRKPRTPKLVLETEPKSRRPRKPKV